MVEHPIDYPWSSYRVNAGKKPRRQLVMRVIMFIVSCFQSI
jgi:hypothetical protein